jgi:secreted PhoX family phosphatase
MVSPTLSAATTGEFGRNPDTNTHHARDLYGYLAEIDPGVDPKEFDGKTTPGTGHKKLGYAGRARWENATFAVGSDWRLVPDKPVVFYAGDDRRSGRIYKFVSSAPYTAGMSRAQIRALLDDGTLYVAQFDGLNNATGDTLLTGTVGSGRWIELSIDSDDLAVNAAALGAPTKTVGQALQDMMWNGIGGFASDDAVRRSLFTASAKIGIMELNRPEDMEWNPLDPSGTPRIYVAFTNHARKVALNQDGVLYDPAVHGAQSPTRPDPTGSIWTITETDPANPGTSMTFAFTAVWRGTLGDGKFDAANPDNLMIDAQGGLWFGTDGNYGTNGHADALYYLDLDTTHEAGDAGIVQASHGKAFRVIAGPSDGEATGPAFSSGMGTVFFNVQHPGEAVLSTWPNQ